MIESPRKDVHLDKSFSPRKIFEPSLQKSFEELKRPKSLIKVSLKHKLKLQEYMRRLDITPSPVSYKNPFAVKENDSPASSLKRNKLFYVDPREPCIDELIESMLSNSSSSLRKDSNLCAKSLDPKRTNHFLKEMMHIAKNGIKKKIRLDLLEDNTRACDAEEF